MKTFNADQYGASASRRASALIAVLIAVGILSSLAAATLLTAVPAYRGTYHAAAWHEARLAADAGIDLGVAAIQSSLPDTSAYTWPGWSLLSGSPVPLGSNEIRVITPPVDLLAHAGDGSTRPSVLRVEIDVITRDDNVSRNPWYRVRSTGSAELASSQLGLDKRDGFLRRMNLQQKRITRTVEVLVRPLYLWEYALKTAGSMVLGGGTNWKIDSYDSRWEDITSDHRGSTNGMYDPAKAGAFGNIACNLERPADSPFGVLIDAEGALVRGEVQTHGGDDPTTVATENVENGDQIDQTKISSDFEEVLLPAENPIAPALNADEAAQVRRIVTPWLTGPAVTNPGGVLPSSVGMLGTSEANPLRILLRPRGGQSQGGFSVAAPDPSQGPLQRFVEIFIDADLVLGGGGIHLPPNVYAKIFVNGNVDLKNQDVNYSPTSSRTPGNLQIYGVSSGAGPAPKVDSAGNGHFVGVFYGPQYAGNLDGNTEIIGGFVLNTYNIAGGGGSGGDSVGAGLHYDEALGVVGPIQSYRVVSYFEDSRRNVE